MSRHRHYEPGSTTKVATAFADIPDVPGPQGEPGPQGVPGPKGDPGEVPPGLATFADGQARKLYVLSDGTLTTIAPVPPVVDDPPQHMLFLPVPQVDRPTVGQTIIDKTFKTEVTRLTDVQLRRNYYPTQCSFSKDDEFIGLYYYGDWRLINGKTLADMGPIPTGVDVWQWANTELNRMWGIQWNMGLRTRTTGAWQTFLALGTGALTGLNYVGGSRFNLQDDDRGMPVIGAASRDTKGNGIAPWCVLVINPQTGSLIARVDTGAAKPVTAQLMRSGTVLVVQFADPPGAGAGKGTWFYALPSGVAIGQASQGNSHCTEGWDDHHNDIHITLADGGRIITPGLIKKPLFEQANNFNSGAGGHITANATNMPGVALLSSGVKTSLPGQDQLFLIKTDGSGMGWPFCHAHAANLATAGYDATPFASLSRAGNAAVFGSTFDGDESKFINAYYVKRPQLLVS